MIVRINEIDISTAEAQSGWDLDPRRGPFVYSWPADAHAFEVLVLDHDEEHRRLDASFLHEQLRQLVIEVVNAMTLTDEAVIYRFDGSAAERELMPVIEHLSEWGDLGRYVISDIAKLEPGPLEVIGSVRLQLPEAQIASLLGDDRVGLERSVRLRVMSVPEAAAPLVLETVACDDDRWLEMLPEAGFVLGTTRGLRSLQVMTRRFDAATIKTRLMRRLLAAAQGVGA